MSQSQSVQYRHVRCRSSWARPHALNKELYLPIGDVDAVVLHSIRAVKLAAQCELFDQLLPLIVLHRIPQYLKQCMRFYVCCVERKRPLCAVAVNVRVTPLGTHTLTAMGAFDAL